MLDALVAALDPHAAAMTATNLRRGVPGASCFAEAPDLYYRLLRELEAQANRPTPTPAAAAVSVEHEHVRADSVVEGQASPGKLVRRRVLVESPHYLKDVA